MTVRSLLLRLSFVALCVGAVGCRALGLAHFGAMATRGALQDDRHPGYSTSASHYESASRTALNELCNTVPEARKLRARAAAVLVIPEIYELSLIMGGGGGTGTLFKGGRASGFYSASRVAVGLQAGGQRYSLAIFFMSAKDLEWIKRKGWTFGTGTTVTILDEESIRTLSSSATRKGIYVFSFGQAGLLAGITFEGMTISPIYLGDK